MAVKLKAMIIKILFYGLIISSFFGCTNQLTLTDNERVKNQGPVKGSLFIEGDAVALIVGKNDNDVRSVVSGY